jgi:hypothetical protein
MTSLVFAARLPALAQGLCWGIYQWILSANAQRFLEFDRGANIWRDWWARQDSNLQPDRYERGG